LRQDINNILIIRGNCVNIVNKDSISINNIYKNIVYFILSINVIRSLKAKGKGLQIARDIIKQRARVKERLL
jgi:hypothetical protein